MAKETYLCGKRDHNGIQMRRDRRESYALVGLLTLQGLLIDLLREYIAKETYSCETYLYCKRDLLMWQERPRIFVLSIQKLSNFLPCTCACLSDARQQCRSKGQIIYEVKKIIYKVK